MIKKEKNEKKKREKMVIAAWSFPRIAQLYCVAHLVVSEFHTAAQTGPTHSPLESSCPTRQNFIISIISFIVRLSYIL